MIPKKISREEIVECDYEYIIDLIILNKLTPLSKEEVKKIMDKDEYVLSLKKEMLETEDEYRNWRDDLEKYMRYEITCID